jgi:hypothetical protein
MSSATPLTTCSPIIRRKVADNFCSDGFHQILTGGSRVGYSHNNIRTVLHAPCHLQILFFQFCTYYVLIIKSAAKVHEGLRNDYVQNNEVLNFVSGTSL